MYNHFYLMQTKVVHVLILNSISYNFFFFKISNRLFFIPICLLTISQNRFLSLICVFEKKSNWTKFWGSFENSKHGSKSFFNYI